MLSNSVLAATTTTTTTPLPQSEVNALDIYPNYIQNYPTTCSSSTTGGSGVPGGTSTITGTAAWNATVQRPYYLEQFIINVLEDIAAVANVPTTTTVTQEHVIGMVAWAYAEGGNIANTDIFNIWNTGIDDPSLLAGAAAGDGTQSFKSFDAGVTGATETMTDSNQNRIEKVLTQPNTTAEQFVQALTYYQYYPGNHAWAQADEDNQQSYYNTLMSLVTQTRANYAEEASVEIGFGQEGRNHVPASELMFKGGGASNPTSPTTTTSPTSTTTSGSGCTGSTSSTGASISCVNGTTATGNAAIACDVLKYASIKYSQAGHKLPSVWHQQCPTIGPSCATDCSGLVSIAIYDVFGLDEVWTTFGMVADPHNFQRIQLSQVQPGDLVEPNPDHVEVIESVQGNTLNDFAAHSESSNPEVGPDTITAEPGYVYLRYIGQGAS
jgi:hypothetical protein